MYMHKTNKMLAANIVIVSYTKNYIYHECIIYLSRDIYPSYILLNRKTDFIEFDIDHYYLEFVH